MKEVFVKVVFSCGRTDIFKCKRRDIAGHAIGRNQDKTLMDISDVIEL